MDTASPSTPPSYCQAPIFALALAIASVATTPAQAQQNSGPSITSVTRTPHPQSDRSGGNVQRDGGNNQPGADARARADHERAEKERIERERAEKERIEKARADKERADRERAERAERERLEKERADRERAERERAERAERERLEKERADRERAERQRAERERAARAERERLEKERADRERAERERAEKEKAERAERERAEKARAEKEKAERERAEKEKAERERAEKERAERDQDEADGHEDGDGEEGTEWTDLTIGRVTASGTGCPGGTWRAKIDGSGQGFEVQFGRLTAAITPTQAESVVRCRLTIVVPTKGAGMSYRVGRFAYSGYTYLESGVRAEFVTDYAFAGDSSSAFKVRTELEGPMDREYTVEDVADGEALWSPCTTSNTFTVDVTVRLTHGDKRADGVIEVADATGLAFDLRACE